MTDEKTGGFSCDWQAPSELSDKGSRSALYRFGDGYRWQGVELQRYKDRDGSWMDVARQVLVGERGESCRFDLRYFEIAPGGFSTLETHEHVHVVVVIRGRGQALVEGELKEVGFLDTLYLAPNDPHQLVNHTGEPFGFFCIVDHERDRPVPLTEEEAKDLRARGFAVRGGALS